MKLMNAKVLLLVERIGVGAMAAALALPWISQQLRGSYLAICARFIESIATSPVGLGVRSWADLMVLLVLAAPALAVAWAAVAALASLAGREKAVGGFGAAGVAGVVAAACYAGMTVAPDLAYRGAHWPNLGYGLYLFAAASLVLTAAGFPGFFARKGRKDGTTAAADGPRPVPGR